MKKRRFSNPQLMAEFVKKLMYGHLRILDDVRFAPEEDDPTWSARRRKVVEDARKPISETPMYMRIVEKFGTSLVKAQEERTTHVHNLGIMITGKSDDANEWGKLINETREKASLPPIDVEAIEVKAKKDGE